MPDIKKIIKDAFGPTIYQRGSNYPKDKIELVKRYIDDGKGCYMFEIEHPQYYWQEYNVAISNDFKGNLGYGCNCNSFYYNHACEHIAACLYYYGNTIINTSKDKIIKSISNSILENLKISKEFSYTPKEELTLSVELEKRGKINLKIGTTKQYMMKTKMKSFLECYTTGTGIVNFGKNFEYNPEIHYFNENDEKIINLFAEHYYAMGEYSGNRELLELNHNAFKHLLELIKDKGFNIKDVAYIDHIYNGFPISSSISKKNNDYVFKLNYEDEIIALTDDYEYIVYQNKCYHLKKQDAKVLSTFIQNDIDNLVFDKENLNNFSQSILPSVKEKIEVDKTASNIIIAHKPDTKLYFDMNYNDVICNIKLEYGNKEINYFDKDEQVLRDMDYEAELLNDIYSCGFINKNNKFIIDDIDDIGYFLDEGIQKLASKYETFTSSKLKNINIIKNTNIKSTFSIGKDNIMRYDFDLGEITADELDKVFNNLNKKKKYYKLKSGNIIDLNNSDELRQLEALAESLDLSKKALAEGTGEIPKYRALYLDSLKNSKYDIIKTDNLFDSFIENFNNYKDMKVKFTKEEESTLRDYQKIGVKWLYNIHKCSFGGILADEMGLGKSVQVLILLRKILKDDAKSKFLIIAPTSLVYNWENEIKKFIPEIDYQIFAGIKEKRHELFKKKTTIYVTSYGLIREDFEYYENINFKVCVIDEGHNIKNPNALLTTKVKQIKAETKLALTGTPLENSVIELWSIYDFIMPGFLSSLLKFQSKYNIKDFNEDNNKKIGQLSKQIAPFMLRRRKKDVLNELPDKIENNIFIDLNESQKKLYAKELEKVNEEIERIVSESGWSKARFMFLQLLTKLRQICIDPAIIYENYKEQSSKMENLIKVVKESVENGHKILIFTSFKTALEIAKTTLSNEGITSYVIDGSVSAHKRMELVEKFNSDDTNVFLIMLKAGGTGLNLTSADVVIHLDIWWNPQAENQATDRAHRIGQKNNVEVIKLITRGTIEERILELQEKKKILSEKLIEGEDRDKNVLEKLSDEDLKYLLSREQE